ncbi:MAG TPA: hypothetical protein VJA18_04075 [Candidatus Nanoarchaeia archaeon]|nr:hypothetical protein [Candidatus Nanoarchaeia archaeon]
MTEEKYYKLKYIWNGIDTTGHYLLGAGFVVYGAAKHDSEAILFGSLLMMLGTSNGINQRRMSALETRISELERNQLDQE